MEPKTTIISGKPVPPSAPTISLEPGEYVNFVCPVHDLKIQGETRCTCGKAYEPKKGGR